MIKIAINGFGRIGRLSLRKILNEKDLEVVAINDLTDTKTLAHLFKYDSAQKRIDNEVSYTDDSIIIDKKEIKIYKEMDPVNLPWGNLGVDVVLECTGVFRTREKAYKHIEAGAKKVLISAPSDSDVKTIVYNVNHEILNSDDLIVSGASCTTNALAPIAKVLNDNFKINTGYMITTHAYTNDQNLLDLPHKKGDLRRARAAASNIVPNETGAAKAIGLVLPELKGKLDGSANRVPVVTGSLVELICEIDKEASIEAINNAFKNSANESLGYNTDEIVSSDIIGINYGSLFDSTLTKVISSSDKQLVKIAAWYDNEFSYTSQLIRTLKYLGEL